MVILVEIQGNQNSLLLPVKITVQSRLGRLDVEVNEVSSAYDTDAAKYMRDAIWSEKTEGVGVFYITEKAKTLVNGGLQLPTKLQQALASSDGIVHQIPEKINMAVSTNTQSIQFTNWFGDWQNPQLSKKKVSVVVNEDRISFFATDSMQTAGTYSGTSTVRSLGDESKSSLGMYQLYANTDGMVEFDAKGAESNHIALGLAEKDYNDVMYGKVWYSFATAKQLAKYAKRKGYTGVIIKNVVDTDREHI